MVLRKFRNWICCKGFPPFLNKVEVKKWFLPFGEVMRIRFTEEANEKLVYVQFKTQISVIKILSHGDNLWMHGSKILVNPWNKQDQQDWRQKQFRKEVPDLKNLKELPSNEIAEENTLFDEVNKALNVVGQQCQSVSHQFQLFTHLMILSQEDHFNRRMNVNMIMQILYKHFPDGCVISFGSGISNFGDKDCNLDLLFEPTPGFTDNSANYKMDPSTSSNIFTEPLNNSHHEILQKVDFALKQDFSNSISEDFFPTHEFVSYLQKDKNINCRIFCSNMLLVYGSQLLRFYSKYDLRVIPLVIVIRNWAKYHKLIVKRKPSCQKYRFSNYTLTWMVLFFLQNTDPPVIPPVEVLMTSADYSRKVMGIETAFYDDVTTYTKSLNTTSVEFLLWEFFNFYNGFDYSLVISPRTGQALDRKSIIHNVYTQQQFQKTLFCVQDPFETSRNLTVDLYAEVFSSFLFMCKVAKEIYKPAEVVRSNPVGYPSWGLLSLFKQDYPNSNIKLFKTELLRPNVINYIKININCSETLHVKYKSKKYYETITSMITYIFNHVLLFNAKIVDGKVFNSLNAKNSQNNLNNPSWLQWKPKEEKYWETEPVEFWNPNQAFLQLNSPCSSNNNEESGTSSNSEDDEEMQCGKRKTVNLEQSNAKSVYGNDLNKNVKSSRGPNLKCIAYIMVTVKYDTWTKRWKCIPSAYNLMRDPISDLPLNNDRTVSMSLADSRQEEMQASFMCRCSFKMRNQIILELNCDDALVQRHLLPFLTYFLPMKMEDMFGLSHDTIQEYFQQEDIFSPDLPGPSVET